jgi:hypothetical protein
MGMGSEISTATVWILGTSTLVATAGLLEFKTDIFLFLFANLVALLFLRGLKSESYKDVALFSILSSIMFLINVSSVTLLALYSFLLVVDRFRKKQGAKQILGTALILIFVTGIPILAWSQIFGLKIQMGNINLKIYSILPQVHQKISDFEYNQNIYQECVADRMSCQ